MKINFENRYFYWVKLAQMNLLTFMIWIIAAGLQNCLKHNILIVFPCTILLQIHFVLLLFVGSHIAISVYSLHRNATVWENPEVSKEDHSVEVFLNV